MTNIDDYESEIERNYKHNFLVNFLDGTTFWFGASFFAYRTILPVYIANLTDNEFVIAFLSMLLATGWLLPQLFTSNWVQHLPQKKFLPVTVGFWTERLPILLLAPAAWLSTISVEISLVLSLIIIAWHIIGAGIIAVAWQDMIAKIFPKERRGRFFGITNFGGTATGVLGASSVAWLLRRFEFPYGYMWSFFIGALFIFISWVFIRMTKEPSIEPKEPRTSQKDFWRQLPIIIRADRNLRRYLFSQVFMGGGSIAIGFLAVYAIKTWGLPDSQAGIFTVAILIGQSLSNLIFGWLADQRGHKIILELSVLSTIVSVGIATLAPAASWFYMVFFLMGVSNAGFMLSGIMFIFEFCQPEIRPTYIGLNNTFNGVIAIVMPFLGGWLISSQGYHLMFWVSFFVSGIGYIMLRLWVKEPRLMSTVNSN